MRNPWDDPYQYDPNDPNNLPQPDPTTTDTQPPTTNPTPPPTTTTPPPAKKSPPPNISPFDEHFTPPNLLPYPALPELPALPAIPNVPVPQLPTRPTPPPFSFDEYTAPQPWNYQGFQYQPWTPPSVSEALTDPSYQWRKQQGEQSLQRWAAARGTLNDSGTANALQDYGQNAASQEYSNIWNRSLGAYQTNFGDALSAYATNRANALEAYNTNEANRAATYNTNRQLAVNKYNTNYQTQYEDPYKAAYTAAIDRWTPQVESWRAGINRDQLGFTTEAERRRLGYTTEAERTFQQNQLNYGNAWGRYLNDWERWKDNRDTAILLAQT